MSTLATLHNSVGTRTFSFYLCPVGSFFCQPSIAHSVPVTLVKFLFMALLSVAVLFSVPNVYSAEVTLSWHPNTEPDIAGYKVFSRKGCESYDYDKPAWEGTATSCTVSIEDIEDPDSSTSYYFVARAVNFSAKESSNSDEVCKTLPVDDSDADDMP